MTRPLSHYFIFSGHNSYLEGNQLTSKAGTRTIETGLRNGCRVIELDVYDGPKGQPVCTHGGTLTSSVTFKECLASVAQWAFVTSPYPVILTLESHASQEQQVTMAKTLQQAFGSNLFIPAPDQLAEEGAWASPASLKNKIVIRTKVKPTTAPELARLVYICNSSISSYDVVAGPVLPSSHSVPDSKLPQDVPEFGSDYSKEAVAEQRGLTHSLSSMKNNLRQAVSSKESKAAHSTVKAQTLSTDAAAKCSMEPMPSVEVAVHELQVAALQDDTLALQPDMMPGGAAGSKALPGAADNEAMKMVAEANESSSLPAGLKMVHLAAVFHYTSKHLLRCYPSGWRMVDNSNYNPFLPWSLGFSLAALNVQLWDEPVWTNNAFFSQQNNSGYVLKPDYMTIAIPEKGLPPRTPRILAVTVYSAHREQGRRFGMIKDDPYVELKVHGLPCDTTSVKTQHKMDTGRLIVNKTFELQVSYPELAVLLILLKDYDVAGTDTVLSFTGLPLATLAPGEYKLRLSKPYKMLSGAVDPVKTWVKVKLEWLEDAPAASGTGGGAARDPAASGPWKSLARDVEDLENEFVESGLPQAM
eukprot:gene8795-8974_t